MGAYLNIMKFTLGLPLRIQSTIAGGHDFKFGILGPTEVLPRESRKHFTVRGS